MVGEDGHVTIMDFGLAQLTEASRMTRTDETVGAVAYMSPEQTDGSGTDHRTDIWSLGVVLYEMITGRQPFKGDYDKAVMYSILNEEPEPITGLRTGVPLDLERTVGKCLDKDVATRYQHADELIADLTAHRRSLDTGGGATEFGTPASGRPMGRAADGTKSLLALKALACLAAGFIAAWLSMGDGGSAEKSVRKFTFRVEGLAPGGEISPDGERIAYLTSERESKLWVRDLDSWESRALAGTEGARRISWSPDGKWLAFATRSAAKKVSLEGGSVIVLCKRPIGAFPSVRWGQAGASVIFSTGFPRRIYRVSSAGGEPQSLLEAEESGAGVSFASPFPLLGSARDAILYTRGSDNLVVEDLTDSSRSVLAQRRYPVYDSSGHIVFQQGGGDSLGMGAPGTLWALPFALQGLEATGEPFPVGSGEFPSVSHDGTLLFSRLLSASYSLVWRDRTGGRLGFMGKLRGNLLYPSLSLNGRYVAVPVSEASGMHIWVHDTQTGTDMRVTFGDGGIHARPTWGPHDQLTYSSDAEGDQDIYVKSIDGSSPAKTLVSEAETDFADDWSIDGRYMFLSRFGNGGNRMSYLELTDDGTVEKIAPYLQPPHAWTSPAISPDGRFFAYSSSESGRFEIYVQSFPNPSGKWLVSTDGGSQARWSRDGKELFYVEDDTMIAVSVSLEPTFSMSVSERVFSTPELRMTTGPQRYDVSADGKRFVTFEAVEPTSTEFGIVQNSYEEFRDRK